MSKQTNNQGNNYSNENSSDKVGVFVGGLMLSDVIGVKVVSQIVTWQSTLRRHIHDICG